MFIQKNPNPYGKIVGDCVIRAISIALGMSWVDVYIDLCLEGLRFGIWGNYDAVWGSYLKSKGFEREALPNSCPDCYTVKQFANDHKDGIFILATGSHVVTIVNGSYVDTWDSGDEVPVYVWRRKYK